MSFVHHHCHSSYSTLDGAMTPLQIAERIKEIGQSAVAITDHGNMHGVIKFWDACKKTGIKPIIGMEAYLSPIGRLHKEPIKDIPPAFHLTLLAKNNIGLHNLYKLSSLAYLEGFYHKPRIDNELLTQYHEGIICLSGCLKGKIQWYLQGYIETKDSGWLDLAKEEAQKMQSIFGEDFFMEFQRIIPIQESIVPVQMLLCKEFGIDGVATCDAHYARKEDADFHEQILCLSTGKTIKDEKRMGKMEGLYLKTEQEMRDLWHDLPIIIDNAQVIADRCVLDNDTYDKKTYTIPTFGNDDEKQFELECWEGLEKLGLNKNETYTKRLEYEISTIKKMGFPSYFLIVSDYIKWARNKGIACGPGRGSAAGSLVAYVLNITDVDPIEYGLYFERFLNPGRTGSPPDIDCDLCMHRRGEVIDYITSVYGQDHVAQITTFAEFKPRGACKDFARVQGEPYALGEKASKLVPPPLPGGHEPTWKDTLTASPQLLNDEFSNMINMARKSEGIIKGRGIHASGLIISAKPFDKMAPRCLAAGKRKEITSQWDMVDLERMGLVKMDLLGLTALTVIDKTLQLIPKEQRPVMKDIPRDDPMAYDVICKGLTGGLFQLDGGGGIRSLCMQLQPQSIAEIAAISALYRPGPISNGAVEEYIARVSGKKPADYLVPELEPILKSTYGLLVYQEQAMRIATDLASYTLEDADKLRKAIGKKKPEEMAKEEKKLISGMLAKGIPSDKAYEIWTTIKVFADYSFNLAHAVAYSFITYYTAYLKAHFPAEFYCALLTLHYSQRDKLIEYLGDCRNIDIQVLAPDVNESIVGFSVHHGIIRIGLSAIMSIGKKVAKQIVSARGKEPFKDIFDFYERAGNKGVNKRTIEALAKAGALSSLGIPRSGALQILDELVNHKKELERYESKMVTYKKRLSAYYDREEERRDALERGKKVKAQLKFPTSPKKPTDIVIPEVEELDINKLMELEKEMLGLYITSHPLYSYEAEIQRYTDANTSSLGDHSNGEVIRLIGVASFVKHITTRAGNKMAIVDLEDLHGHVEVVVFSKLYAEVKNLLEEGSILFLRGRLEASEDSVGKVIALEMSALQPKSRKKAMKQPKKVHIYISDAKLLSDGVLKKISEITNICTGNIETVISLQLGGFQYTLDGSAMLSYDGIKQLQKCPHLKIQNVA